MTKELRVWTACLLLAVIGAVQACASSPAPKTPTDAGAVSAELAKSVHAGAVLAVRTLDQVAAAWMDSRKAPTPSELEVARLITESLGKARDILNGAADVDAQIVEVAKQLTLATQMLASVGVAPPKEALPVLEFIEAYAQSRGES